MDCLTHLGKKSRLQQQQLQKKKQKNKTIFRSYFDFKTPSFQRSVFNGCCSLNGWNLNTSRLLHDGQNLKQPMDGLNVADWFSSWRFSNSSSMCGRKHCPSPRIYGVVRSFPDFDSFLYPSLVSILLCTCAFMAFAFLHPKTFFFHISLMS